MRPNLENLKVVLVRTRNPLNIGAAARAMSNFGVEHLRVVQPYDVAFREARSAVGAAGLLSRAKEFPTVAEAITDCSLVIGTTSGANREIRNEIYPVDRGSEILQEHLAVGPVALLFGSEKVGLSNQDISRCHWLMRIPTREEHSSMNLAQAVAVCLFEIGRFSGVAEAAQSKSFVAAETLERISDELMDILLECGYLKSRSPVAEKKIRQMVWRLSLESEDGDRWLGMLRQISWKLGKKSE